VTVSSNDAAFEITARLQIVPRKVLGLAAAFHTADGQKPVTGRINWRLNEPDHAAR